MRIACRRRHARREQKAGPSLALGFIHKLPAAPGGARQSAPGIHCAVSTNEVSGHAQATSPIKAVDLGDSASMHAVVLGQRRELGVGIAADLQ